MAETQLINKLKKAYPFAKCSLDYETPFQLLVATVLSAQCTDIRVNMVTEKLFRVFKDAKAMAQASEAEIADIIRSTGFFRQKAKSIKSLSIDLINNHNGEVPKSLEALIELRGVGRKTANVVMGNAFETPVGVVVDTHVGRITRRLGLTKNHDPVKVESDLVKKIPKQDWTVFSHLLIEHGRKICKSRNPLCAVCFLAKTCPKKGVKI